MRAAITGNLAGHFFEKDREMQVGGSGRAGKLRRVARIAAMASAVIFLFPGAGRQARAQTFTIMHTLSGTDGSNPYLGSLVLDASRNLYGTTFFGGSLNWGTVFKVDAAGNESVLHTFNGTDGGDPAAGLILDTSGRLCGTTELGGSTGYGTVFAIDAAGKESVLHSFVGADGAFPQAGLMLDVSGNLYGTTLYGGSANGGTVFKIDAAGDLTVLHEFNGGSDGSNPYAGLVRDASGNLYGTTFYGGTSGYGTVFKIDTAGKESVLHSFNGSDGANPEAGLVLDASGNLYGTTLYGGSANAGTVFKIIASTSNEIVVHSFNGNDGANPYAALVMDGSGRFYGTTTLGGSAGYGTVFEIDSGGNESVLHSFDWDGGAFPYAGLVRDEWGDLYGTTWGSGSAAFGTIFKIDFSLPFSSFSAKLDTTSGPPPGFQLQAFFTQGAGASAIDPVSQGMTLTVGSYTVVISPGSFRQMKKGSWVYEGTIAGVTLNIRISQSGANLYTLQVDASGVDLTALKKPVTVTLALGNNSGTTQVSR